MFSCFMPVVSGNFFAPGNLHANEVQPTLHKTVNSFNFMPSKESDGCLFFSGMACKLRCVVSGKAGSLP